MKHVGIIELLLVGGILAGVAGHVFLRQDPSRRGLEFMPNMVESVAYEAQDPNPNFPDGKTLQRPPAGTVARGYLPAMQGDVLLDGTTEWEKLPDEQRAAWNAFGPAEAWSRLSGADQARALTRGEQVYRTFCLPCHGAGGRGDGVVVARGVPPPKSFLAEDIKALSDGHMFRSITHGKGNMAPYASQVEREDRWKAIRYIRSLQGLP